MSGVIPFLSDGLKAREPTLVVLPTAKLELIRAALGNEADAVEFADMHEVGHNPARIIPAWERFVAAHPGRRVRGIGEPIYPERTDAALRECQHHERLLNPALADSDLYLLCPYDTRAMSADVLDEAQRSHPYIRAGHTERPSRPFDEAHVAHGFLAEALSEPPAAVDTLLDVRPEQLPELREFTRACSRRAGLAPQGEDDFVLVVNELATNAIRHGDGFADIRIWNDDDELVAEVIGRGAIADPLVDRRRRDPLVPGQHGLLIANQLCDLVQLRSISGSVVVRAHMETDERRQRDK